MSTDVMSSLCPDHRFIGAARLDGYRLAFSRRSQRTATGVADVIADSAPNACVWGALYELEEPDLKRLDRKEGGKDAYTRQDVVVRTRDGRTHEAVTYCVVNKEPSEIAPARGYLHRLVRAARQRSLPSAYVDSLGRWLLAPDEEFADDEPPMVAEVRADFQYDHALRTVERDRQVLAGLRTRTNVLLTATSVVTALLGQAVLQHHPIRVGLTVAAIVAFGIGLFCCLGVLWPIGDRGTGEREVPPPDDGSDLEGQLVPEGIRGGLRRFRQRWGEWRLGPGRRRWKVTLTEQDIVDAMAGAERADRGQLETAIKQELATLLFEWHRRNMATIERRTDLLQVAGLALFIQVVLWALAAML